MNADYISKHIGQVCQQYRIKNNLTQNQVAELTGLEPRHISQIERGLSKGSIDTLIKLCNIYNITPNDLLSEYIYFDIEKSNIELAAFYSLSVENQQMILDLISFFNQKEKHNK